MMKEWFPRHQWSINWMCSPHGAWRTAQNMRENQWRRVNVLPHVDWSFLLLGSEKRERVCALSCWLALSCCWPVGKRVEEYVLCHVCWLVLLLASEKVRREREMVSAAFYVAPGRWPGQNGFSHSHWVKYINSNSNGQSNSHTKW